MISTIQGYAERWKSIQLRCPNQDLRRIVPSSPVVNLQYAPKLPIHLSEANALTDHCLRYNLARYLTQKTLVRRPLCHKMPERHDCAAVPFAYTCNLEPGAYNSSWSPM